MTVVEQVCVSRTALAALLSRVDPQGFLSGDLGVAWDAGGHLVTAHDAADAEVPFHCYPCARGNHGQHKMNAWEPGIPCECPPCAIPYRHGPHLVDDGRIQQTCLGSSPNGPQESVAALEVSRQAEQAERRALDAEAAIEAARDLLDGWEQDGPDDPAVHLLILRVRAMLGLQQRFGDGRAARPLPLHRTEAGYPNCSTCDGGGCHDCTDPG